MEHQDNSMPMTEFFGGTMPQVGNLYYAIVASFKSIHGHMPTNSELSDLMCVILKQITSTTHSSSTKEAEPNLGTPQKDAGANE